MLTEFIASDEKIGDVVLLPGDLRLVLMCELAWPQELHSVVWT